MAAARRDVSWGRRDVGWLLAKDSKPDTREAGRRRRGRTIFRAVSHAWRVGPGPLAAGSPQDRGGEGSRGSFKVAGAVRSGIIRNRSRDAKGPKRRRGRGSPGSGKIPPVCCAETPGLHGRPPAGAHGSGLASSGADAGGCPCRCPRRRPRLVASPRPEPCPPPRSHTPPTCNLVFSACPLPAPRVGGRNEGPLPQAQPQPDVSPAAVTVAGGGRRLPSGGEHGPAHAPGLTPAAAASARSHVSAVSSVRGHRVHF